jgi:hypothetical protein
VGPFREGAFRSPLHDERTAAWLGIALGIAFGICFLTGLISHLIQKPPGWFLWPSRPVNLYRVTQGLHVATGVLSIPLLLGKLWVVYPHLWTWPPVQDIAHAIERLSLVPLVAGSLFLLFSGVANIALWYPWQFFFPTAHYWASWITMGALIVHIGAKFPITVNSMRRRPEPDVADLATREPLGGGVDLSRRGFLAALAAAAGTLTLTTVGQTFHSLSSLGALAPRRPDVGPQGLPVNKSAVSAGVRVAAADPAYRLSILGRVQNPLTLSLEQLRRLPQREALLPISCVEGWSASGVWRGIPVRDLLELAGAPPEAEVEVESMQRRGLYNHSLLNRLHVQDPDTLLAMDLNGELLHVDHGFPIRLIGPNRPGVMQTKWVHRLVVR